MTEKRGKAGLVHSAIAEHGEKLRFLAIGAANTAFSYALFVVLLVVFGPVVRVLDGSSISALAVLGREYYLVVQWTAWFLAVPVSTLTMKYFAFRSGGRLGRQIIRAYFVYLPAQGISAVILWAGVRGLGLNPAAAQFVAIVVTTIFSYVGHKYFTFRTPLEVGEVPPQEMIEG